MIWQDLFLNPLETTSLIHRLTIADIIIYYLLILMKLVPHRIKVPQQVNAINPTLEKPSNW